MLWDSNVLKMFSAVSKSFLCLPPVNDSIVSKKHFSIFRGKKYHRSKKNLLISAEIPKDLCFWIKNFKENHMASKIIFQLIVFKPHHQKVLLGLDQGLKFLNSSKSSDFCYKCLLTTLSSFWITQDVNKWKCFLYSKANCEQRQQTSKVHDWLVYRLTTLPKQCWTCPWSKFEKLKCVWCVLGSSREWFDSQNDQISDVKTGWST